MQYLKELLSLPKKEQRLAFEHIANVKKLRSLVVEKDFWVTAILHILFGKICTLSDTTKSDR